jgi:outer membrane protein OmpA-like peptidoglycan-associated protein
VQLNNIFFDFDKTGLNEESVPELTRVLELMEENPEMCISVQGHTDNIGTVAYNKILSERRAKAVVDYLIEQGVNVGRLHYVGWGKSKPMVSNNDKAGRETNRRVEFKILEE